MKNLSNLLVFSGLVLVSSYANARQTPAINQVSVSISGGSCREAVLRSRSTDKRIIVNLKVTYVTGGVGGGGTTVGNKTLAVEPGGEESLGCTHESYPPPASGWTDKKFEIVGARYAQ
jgi:hypothetical protein